MKSDSSPIVLVQPPYLRLVGSHNDRIPLELCYLSAHLRNAGLETIVFNAGWTGASKYLRWQRLFENFEYFCQAADGFSPLYDETVERILSLDSRTVVISAADSLTPWVDLGNPYIAAHLSDKLRHEGLFTVGVGPLLARVPWKFAQRFDAIVTGMASSSIVDVVERQLKGIQVGKLVASYPLPCTDVEPSPGRDDVVMTAFGCPYRCAFCLARGTRYTPLPIDEVVRDIANRRATKIDIGDSIFPLSIYRVRTIGAKVVDLHKEYSCEINVSTVAEPALEALCSMDVTMVKLGVESADESVLSAMGKHQTRESIVQACNLIKEYGLKLGVYVLLGGPFATPKSVEDTYQLCQDLAADDYVINVWSFHDLDNRDFRYDAHFSQRLVELWGLEDMIERFFGLQAPIKAGLGPLI